MIQSESFKGENTTNANYRLVAFSDRRDYLLTLHKLQRCWEYGYGKEWQWWENGSKKGQPLDDAVIRQYNLHVHLLTR